jgi:hypothetical protein
MKNKRTNKNLPEDKKSKEKDFASIGDKQQVKSEPKPIIEEKPVYFDGTQYSCKIPKKIMEEIGYKNGDALKFIVSYPKDVFKIPNLEIKYVRSKNGSN